MKETEFKNQFSDFWYAGIYSEIQMGVHHNFSIFRASSSSTYVYNICPAQKDSAVVDNLLMF